MEKLIDEHFKEIINEIYYDCDLETTPIKLSTDLDETIEDVCSTKWIKDKDVQEAVKKLKKEGN